MEEVQGAWLASAMGIFFGWAFLAWLVRVWAKLRTKAWGLDDYAISGSLLAALLHIVFLFHAIAHGYGKPFHTLSASSITRVQTGLYLAQIFYIVSFGLCRVAAALFIAYISQAGPHIQPARLAAVVTVLWTVISLLAISIRGDRSRPWEVLDGSNDMFSRWLGTEITGIVIELVLWGIAAHLVWGIQLKLSRRIIIICAFGARLLVVPFVIARLVLLSPQINTGADRSATMADLVTEACVHFSIISGSATALKPLLTSFYSTHPAAAAVELTASTSSGLRCKDGHHDSYYRLETFRPAGLDQKNSDGGGAGGKKKVVINRATARDITWQTVPQEPRSHHASSASSKSRASNSVSRSVTNSRTSNSAPPRSLTSARADEGGLSRKRDTLTEALKTGLVGRKESHVSSESDDSGRMIIQKTTEVTVHYK
ncbi:hypothetical protein V2A60_004309 [Cordyceps javanica]